MSYLIGPLAIKKGKINIISDSPLWNNNYETIERKGLGHPDTISDMLAAKISQAYSKYTLDHFGVILHHQIDKLMVIGGKTNVSFGHGKFIKPIQIVVAGRISYTFGSTIIPVDKILKDVIITHFKENFPLVKNKDIFIKNFLTNFAGPGTINKSKGAIANMFNPKTKIQVRGYDKLVANDTSYCTAYSPLSNLEKSIIEVEKYLNSKEIKITYPWLGTDIKIMAVRNYKKISITLCIPQIAKFVKSLKEYQTNLGVIGKVIDNKFKKLLPYYNIEISLNTKDDYEEMNIYLTASGASLSGDVGVVGRGNRTNGLITSNRPMSMEGTNGKNPRYYSGFIYANLVKKISQRIQSELNQQNIVEMVSQNGGPLNKPWQTRIITKANKKKVKKIVKEELENIESITQDFLDGKLENF